MNKQEYIESNRNNRKNREIGFTEKLSNLIKDEYKKLFETNKIPFSDCLIEVEILHNYDIPSFTIGEKRLFRGHQVDFENKTINDYPMNYFTFVALSA